ncbi:hypothetical protein [Sanyastnella coralliicola]|uniref:hypothetical protein n=1 Tax=Sanyastnella coralliicola TaxID=3069118 RepID=UPI0027B9B8AA|nr:hypothetical protein [Longitalea sp. SCSIO 12813]
MKRITYRLLAGTGIGLLLLTACADEKTQDSEQEQQEVSVDEANDNAVTSSLLKLDSEIFSLPSPVQTAMLLKKNEIPYSEELLNSTANTEKYLNQFQKALNMGVYGADLAYLSNFNNAQLKLDYFKVVEDLATDLNVRNAIDQQLIDRFASNIDNQDSLYNLNAALFQTADRYLKDNKDDELAALILAGGWVEALHLSLDPAANIQELRVRIGEQGNAARSLVSLLGKSEDAQTLELASKLAALASEFKALNRDYEYVKPITDATERVTYLNSKSNIQMTDEQLEAIKTQVGEIRAFIIQ